METGCLENGIFAIDAGVVIKKGLFAVELLSEGLVFDREIDFKNGWVVCVSRLHIFHGRRVNMSFRFFDKGLKAFSFSLVDDGLQDIGILKCQHDAFLLEWIGEPQRENEFMKIYEFLWGDVTSQVDPRNGGSSVEINWV